MQQQTLLPLEWRMRAKNVFYYNLQFLHANFLMLLIFCENATREWLFAELSTRTDDGTRVVSEIYPKTFQCRVVATDLRVREVNKKKVLMFGSPFRNGNGHQKVWLSRNKRADNLLNGNKLGYILGALLCYFVSNPSKINAGHLPFWRVN